MDLGIELEQQRRQLYTTYLPIELDLGKLGSFRAFLSLILWEIQVFAGLPAGDRISNYAGSGQNQYFAVGNDEQAEAHHP